MGSIFSMDVALGVYSLFVLVGRGRSTILLFVIKMSGGWGSGKGVLVRIYLLRTKRGSAERSGGRVSKDTMQRKSAPTLSADRTINQIVNRGKGGLIFLLILLWLCLCLCHSGRLVGLWRCNGRCCSS